LVSKKNNSKKQKQKKKSDTKKRQKSIRAEKGSNRESAGQMQSTAKHSIANSTGSLPPFRVLDPDGNILAKEPELSMEVLLRAYRNMVLTRILDEKLIGLQRQGRMGTYVSCSGQEASQIGTVLGLSLDTDWIFPMYRDMGMIIQAGVSTRQLVNRMLGNSEDVAKGRDLPNLFAWKDHKIVSFAAPIASHVPLAVGYAIAAKLRREPLVTVATFGDGASSSGEFHVAMNFAGVYKAPVIFVCENNQYAISVPVSQQTASESIAIKARAYGFDGIKVDGNDLFAVYDAVRKAAKKAREGGGPTLIECFTYRLSSHSTADDWKKYRSNDEVETWRKRDPILRLKEYLIHTRSSWSEEKDGALRSELEAEISKTISECERLPPPPVETLFEDVYSSVSENLKMESEELSSNNQE
jgi:pyruvate dehydrogenase E1 component alpha subunit